jgi:predicted metalloprotease
MVKNNQLNELDRLQLRFACQNSGDDRLCKLRGKPLDITHGTGAQREAWFLRGLRASSLAELDPYSDHTLMKGFNFEQQTIIKYFLAEPLQPLTGSKK